MASDLGAAAVNEEFLRGAAPGTTRQVWVSAFPTHIPSLAC